MIMTLGERAETLGRVPSLRDTASMPVVHLSAAPAADEQVLRYAPLLRFSRDETHFPIDPADFVRHARLRRYGWSDDVRDAVWHPRRACWEAAALDLPVSSGAEGPDIAEACRLIQSEARGSGADARNRRPCDPRNLWYGRRAGYALELGGAVPRALHGTAGSAPFLFYDRYSVPTHAGVFDVISYWFFFALSPSAIPHEGDWQSVSVMVPDDGTEVGVRFDSPRGALTCGIGETQLAYGTHPVAYVEPGSHGLCRSAEDVEGGHSDTWTGLHSWEVEAVRVPTLAWSSFDGAWGRVGPGPRSTGPLGPLFRREGAGTMRQP